jgi:predicted transcriptional regulator
MNQIAVAPEVLVRFHELAAATQRSDAEVIDEALNSYLAADHRYVETLAERIAAADRGEFASDAAVERFFAEHAE